MHNVDHYKSLQFAVEMAHAAGDLTLRTFQGEVATERKPDRTLVTAADRGAEMLCRDMIEKRFPDYGILGEEFGETRPGAELRWILDPIDGTNSYVRGVPLYGVLIALEDCRAGKVVAGVIHFPALGETVSAAAGAGCWWNDRRAAVSGVSDLDSALVLTTDAERVLSQHREGWERLGDRAELARTWGDCYGHALVATGRAEAMVDPVLAIWDAAPLQIVVEEAGGVYTDWDGGRSYRGASGISTNAALADAVRDALGAARPAPELPAADSRRG